MVRGENLKLRSRKMELMKYGWNLAPTLAPIRVDYPMTLVAIRRK